MILSAEATALLVALLFKRGGQKRARVSEKTVRVLSKRQRLRRSFVGAVQQHLEDLGLILVDLDRGGFGILPSSGLEGAPALTAKSTCLIRNSRRTTPTGQSNRFVDFGAS